MAMVIRMSSCPDIMGACVEKSDPSREVDVNVDDVDSVVDAYMTHVVDARRQTDYIVSQSTSTLSLMIMIMSTITVLRAKNI